MKQIISFKKDIPFRTKIGEITSISLEHSLKMEDSDHIAGEFVVSGDYKITDISINREPFSYNLPFDITLDTKYNTDKAKLDIDDFYYEITNDQVLNVNIDVVIDGIEVINDVNEIEIDRGNEELPIDFTNVLDEKAIDDSEERKSDEIMESINEDELDDRAVMNLFKEIETPPVDITIEATPSVPTDEKIASLFDSFDDKNETFITYHVHIVRETDTIDSIALKYKTTKEEIIAYNKIEELKLGDKIVIPANINE
jgi:LysM repeat protein